MHVADLREALRGTGLRTPFRGPLSGRHATVGGSVSQNSVYWGAGLFGASADSVVSLEVVLADGRVLHTGTASQLHGTPFFRHFGPDLTGLFTCDNGALGIKSAVTLRLVPERPEVRHLSFDFPDYRRQMAAMSDIARAGLVAQMFGTDPNLAQVRAGAKTCCRTPGPSAAWCGRSSPCAKRSRRGPCGSRTTGRSRWRCPARTPWPGPASCSA